MLNKIIEKYNSSQNKVEVVGTYQGDYWTSGANAITAIATGNGPDLIQLGWGQVRLLSDNEGVAANMLDYMKKEDGVWLEDFREGFVSCFLNKEKKYLPCLPMGCSTPVMYCNTTLLKKAGLEIPKTWDEMQEVCRKLVDGGYSDYGFSEPRDSWYFYMMIPNYSGQEIFSDDELSLGCREGGIAAYTFLQNMVKKNYFYPGPASDSANNCLQLLQAGKSAFFINSIAGLKATEKAAKDGGWDLEVSSVPAGKAASFPSGGNALEMLESSKHKKEVWDFLKWMYTSEDGLAYFDAQSGYLACSNTVKNTKTIQSMMSDDKNYAKAYDFLEKVDNKHLITGQSQTPTEIMKFMDAVFYDKNDVTTEWDSLDTVLKEKLKEAHAK